MIWKSRNFIKQATPFLHNSNLMRRLEIIAAIDELTGVLNRRFGMKRFHEEFRRSLRLGSALSICMLDIDNFKTINDTYGHQAGDQVLKNLSIQLEEELRVSDCIMRYGGEEFVVVLPGASLLDTTTLMNRIRRRVETYELQYGSYQLHYTFSGGLASFRGKDINSPDDMIKIADIALYKAKSGGKNKIVSPA